jgi:ketosteroid isomerase-like protein
MSQQDDVALVLDVFRAIEQRDAGRIRELFAPDISFQWPPSLPYSGARGPTSEGSTWVEIWDPLQPTEAERRMDPRIVATSPEHIVALWRQRGVSPTGDRFDGEVLGLYEVRGQKLARARMFYFDTVALAGFLRRASTALARGSETTDA